VVYWRVSVVHHRRRVRLRGLAWSTCAAMALACGSEKGSDLSGSDLVPLAPDSLDPADTTSRPPPDSLTPDSLPGDSLPVDSLPGDSVPPDSPPPDSVPQVDTLPPSRPPYTGIHFGMFRLWKDSTTLAWGPQPFTMSFNSINPDGIVAHIKAARAQGVTLLLGMSTGHRFITDGKFDMHKWEARMNGFRTPEIQAAVAEGVRDGTIMGNAVLDEPNTKRWGGVLDKPMVDRMCGYVREIFPTLPQGLPVVHWWKPSESYKVCDFIIDQWAWWQGPQGAGEGSYTGNIAAWRDAALAQAKKDGIAIAFSMNMINGGIQSWDTKACPTPQTGGRGTRVPACRMTPDQVREWGLTLGPLGCAMFLWWYDPSFMSKPENVQAIRDVGAKLATTPGRSCRRPR
jgi:hypothetical protein